MEPSILELLQKITDAWVAGQKPTTMDVTYVGNRIAREQQAAAPAPAEAPKAEG